MTQEKSCPNCNLRFSDILRLQKRVKKAHPPKRRIDPTSLADFNHAYFPS